MCQKCKDKSVLRKFSFKFDAENMKKIKVRKFQNEFMKSSFHPKISTKNLCNEGRNCLTFSQSHFGVACQTAQPIQPISTQIGLDYQYLKKKSPKNFCPYFYIQLEILKPEKQFYSMLQQLHCDWNCQILSKKRVQISVRQIHHTGLSPWTRGHFYIT